MNFKKPLVKPWHNAVKIKCQCPVSCQRTSKERRPAGTAHLANNPSIPDINYYKTYNINQIKQLECLIHVPIFCKKIKQVSLYICVSLNPCKHFQSVLPLNRDLILSFTLLKSTLHKGYAFTCPYVIVIDPMRLMWN